MLICSSVGCANADYFISIIENKLPESVQADLMEIISQRKDMISDGDISSEHTNPIDIEQNRYIESLEQQITSLENEKEMYKKQLNENENFDREDLIKKQNSLEITLNEKCEEYEDLLIKYKEIAQRYSDDEYIFI